MLTEKLNKLIRAENLLKLWNFFFDYKYRFRYYNPIKLKPICWGGETEGWRQSIRLQ